MAGILWTIIIVLFALWLIGFFVFHLGAFIHIAIVVAVVLLIINLLSGRGLRV